MIVNVAPGQTEGTAGLDKKIDHGSLKLVFNVLQNTMYSYPIESTVRETVSNAIDAVKEKQIATLILTGQAKVEDYYIDRDGEEYESSKFDPSYYDLKYLSEDNSVKVTYVENEGMGFCDQFIVEDPGIGLSPERMVKMVSLGYSSKRNTLSTIGGFGLGAKSPLSTDVDYFTIESAWNGMRIVVNCYKYKTDFVIGKFNSNFEENPMFETSEGPIYYEPYGGKNYTRITVPCKKTNRFKYKEAVKLQLMYFQEVKFNIINERGVSAEEKIQPKILYNSDNIIISENNYYSKPHIIIVKDEKDVAGVNYGYIDFRELELEDMFGSIGIKCRVRAVNNVDGVEEVIQEGVEVTPSREKVKFSEATKRYIQEKFEQVVAEASQMVEKELKTEDFFSWVKSVNLISTASSLDNDSVLGHMANIVDMGRIAPNFPGTKIRFNKSPRKMLNNYGFEIRNFDLKKSNTNDNGLEISFQDEEVENTGDANQRIPVVRSNVTDWNQCDWDSFYIKVGNAQVKKDKYLMMLNSRKSVTVLDLGQDVLSVNQIIEASSGKMTLEDAEKQQEKFKEIRKILLTKFEEAIQSGIVKKYDDIEVAEDFNEELFDKNLTASKEEEERQVIQSISDAERRKMNDLIVYHDLEKQCSLYSCNTNVDLFAYRRKECSIEDYVAVENLYYGTEDDRDLLVASAAILDTLFMRNTDSVYYSTFSDYRKGINKNFSLIKISRSVESKISKKLSGHRHINDLFYYLNEDLMYESSSEISNWYTSLYVHDIVEKCSFMKNMKTLNPRMYSVYLELSEYLETYYNSSYVLRRFSVNEPVKSKLEFLDKMRDFQLFMQEERSQEEISDMAKEMFNNPYVTGVKVINLEIYNKALLLQDYAAPIATMLNTVGPLTVKDDQTIPDDLREEILLYIRTKGRDPFIISSDIQYKTS